jgi:hypothetical protein
MFHHPMFQPTVSLMKTGYWPMDVVPAMNKAFDGHFSKKKPAVSGLRKHSFYSGVTHVPVH